MAGAYFEALADLSELFGREVDLVDLRVASDSLRSTIARSGHDVA